MPKRTKTEAEVTVTEAAPKQPKTKRTSEEELLAKYPHVVEGSLRYETEGPHANKQTCLINTVGIDGKPDGNQRRVATSDLFQVRHTDEVKRELRKLAAKAKRAAARAQAKQVEVQQAGTETLADAIG